MDNRERDKMKNTGSTSGGNVNRDTSQLGKDKGDSSAEFGQNIKSDKENMNEPNSRSGNTGDRQ